MAGANKTTLDNGIRIVTKRMPNVHSITMGIWVVAGARDEDTTESGLSHFIEHMLFKGTRRRSALQIAQAFDAIGGQTNAFTSYENTCFHAKVLDTHLDTMVDILADILLNSVFAAGEIENERTVILQEIGQLEDSPEEYVHLMAGQQFWGDHPLGRSILGTRETVGSFSVDNIRNFFQRAYQPRHIVIAAAGNLDHHRFVHQVAPAFTALDSGPGLRHKRSAPVPEGGLGLVEKPLEQVHLCLTGRGLAAADPRRFALSLLSTITGGNMSSRLFQQIRERRGLAYAVFAFVSSHEDSGTFGVYAGVHPQKVLETASRIRAELQRLRSQPVSSGELRDAKEFTKASLLLAAESNDNQMIRLAQNEIVFGRHIPLSEILVQIEAVTADDLIELAGELFLNHPTTLTVLGPLPEDADKLRECLAP